jgi:3-hydroxyisobutyrate dehydrogenase-like beta-hydroxyacid dehydrogenase
MTVIAVFGLGEAGSRIATDLAAAGAIVRGYDPAVVPTPAGVHRTEQPSDAVAGAEVVLAITAAADAEGALAQAIDSICVDGIYADLSTAPASLKQSLAAKAEGAHLRFVDVALMAMVPGNGARTPSLASGSGAAAYGTAFAALGFDSVEVISAEAGDAATRKLLRSIFMKGFAAVVIEAMTAAEAAGQRDWLWGNLVDEITAAGAPMLSRLVRGTGPHAVRRLHEMEASAALITGLGVDPIMTDATVTSLHRVIRDGLPDIPVVPDE